MIMNEWIIVAVGSALACIIVYVWQRHQVAIAEQRKSVAEAELADQRTATDQLRRDGAAGLERQADQYKAQIADLNKKLQEAQKRTDEAMAEIRRLESSAKAEMAAQDIERQRIADMEKHYQNLLGQMKSEFKSLSDDVLKEKREQLEKDGLVGIGKVADSLKQEINSFRARIDKINEADVERTASLRKEIETLVGQTQLVSSEADKLATAIRSDAQVTGQWWELQLLRVLELGGLHRTIDYDYQEAFASPGSDHDDLRTDVLVKMPENRWLVIDAKTTMSAYVDFVGEGRSGDSESVRRILESIVEHVKEMKTVEYHKKLAATTNKRILNTMFMYIPFEEVYMMAMRFEMDGPKGKIPLREWAWQNGVVFVNSSGLIPLVRMLAELWDRDRSEKKAQEIKDAAEALLDKFRIFLEGSTGKKDGFLSIGAGLTTAVVAFNESIKRLSFGQGSIMKRMTALKEMGVSSTEILPPSEQVETRQIDVSPIA